MSRRDRRRAAARALASAISASAPVPFGTNGFAGADNFSRERGFVYFPTLDTRREVDSYTQRELLRKARYLYANVGFVKRIVNGIARMVVGVGLSPQATTKDKEWNTLAEKSFEARAISRGVWDLAGKYNFYQMQRAIQRCKIKDGDCGTVLTESAAGMARYALYESHQIGGTNDGFVHGVRTDQHNRAVAYQLLGDNDQKVSISADDLIFFADFERPGQNRGLTSLYHAINHLLDTTEILSFVKSGIKVSNQIGYYIKKQADTPQPGTVRPRNVITQAVTVNGERIALEKIFGGGKIEELNPGETLELLHDDRPHPNTLGALDYLARDISWGCGLSPEVLWAVEKLGGANMRFILQDAQVFIEEQQQELVDIFCTRCWIYHVAKEMKAGRLRRCQDTEWWQHTWTPPARMTVDIGKDGKLYIEHYRSGMLSMKRWHLMQGQDWETEMTQYLDEKKWIKEQAETRGLTMAEVFPAAPGQAAAENDDDEDDLKKRKPKDE